MSMEHDGGEAPDRRNILEYQSAPVENPPVSAAPVVVVATPPRAIVEELLISAGLLLIGTAILLLILASVQLGGAAPLRVSLLPLILAAGLAAVFILIGRVLLRLSRQADKPVVLTIRGGYSITIESSRWWDQPRTWRREEIDHIDVERLGRWFGGAYRYNLRIILVTADIIVVPLTAAEDGFADHVERQVRLVTGPA